jgi:hypothetical protein
MLVYGEVQYCVRKQNWEKQNGLEKGMPAPGRIHEHPLLGPHRLWSWFIALRSGRANHSLVTNCFERLLWNKSYFTHPMEVVPQLKSMN